MIARLFTTLVSAGLASVAYGAEPRQPTSKWVVNFDDAQCVATRNYGTAEQPLYLVLKQPPLGSVMQIALVDQRYASTAAQLNGTLVFGGHAPLKVGILRYQPLKSNKRAHLINLPIDQFLAAQTARTISVRAEGIDETLTLSGVDALMRAMDECTSDLRKVWNVRESNRDEDPQLVGATTNLASVFSADDYPAEAVHKHQGGGVRVALLVDEAGKVADCSIIETSEVPVLDAQTCAIIKRRARFRPAIGPDGKPAKDGYLQRITWRMEP